MLPRHRATNQDTIPKTLLLSIATKTPCFCQPWFEYPWINSEFQSSFFKSEVTGIPPFSLPYLVPLATTEKKRKQLQKPEIQRSTQIILLST
ncbi:hypothetical protein MKW98_026537, partial [Papaver atlanticum]